MVENFIRVLTIDPDAKTALDDIVIGDEMGRGAESRPAMLRREAGCDTPRFVKIGVQEHPAGQMRDPQHVR